MSWQDRSWNEDDAEDGAGARLRRNPMSWSPKIGTIFGIRVEIHILFIIYVAIELLRTATGEEFWWELRYLLVLFGLVFLHEMGHCFGARRLGGQADHILMWPLGGLAFVSPPRRPGAHFAVAFAGPLVNVLVCALAAAVLIAATGSPQAVPWNPFQHNIPPSLWYLFDSNPLRWTYQLFYISYILLLFNCCLPFYPFDGGRMFQALCWYRMGYRRSMLLAGTVGMVGAVLLGCYGLYRQDFLLIGIAVFGYITAMQERRTAAATTNTDDEPYDLSAASWSPTPPVRLQPGAWSRRQRRDAQQQAEVDRILAKIHDQGLASLSRKEKKTLAQATRHQREREQGLGRTDKL
jgi:Zn-dependent protease